MRGEKLGLKYRVEICFTLSSRMLSDKAISGYARVTSNFYFEYRIAFSLKKKSLQVNLHHDVPFTLYINMYINKYIHRFL